MEYKSVLPEIVPGWYRDGLGIFYLYGAAQHSETKQPYLVVVDPSCDVLFPWDTGPRGIVQVARYRDPSRFKAVAPIFSEEPPPAWPLIYSAPLPGLYYHYKGHPYWVFGQAVDHADPNQQFVLYCPLYSEGEVEKGTLNLRPLLMFQQMVEVERKWVPRFRPNGK